MSVIFTDTDCELWYTMIPELGCRVIQMPYTIDDKEYFYDMGENTDFKEFYRKVRAGSMPITSALNAEIYTEIFEPYFAKGEDMLYISFSSKMSGTFNHMEVALKPLREKYPAAKFRRFDTKSISWGAGLQVYYAVKYFNSGKSLDEVYTYLEENINKYSSYFMVDDLNHLKRGGRISPVKAAFGTLFSVKPILYISNEGELEVCEKANGYTKALNALMEKLLRIGDELDKYPVVVIDADNSPLAEKLIERIKLEMPAVSVWHYPIGPVLGTHCGPGTIAVLFRSKER